MIYGLLKAIYDLLQAIMNDINDIMNDKKGHNIMNDIEQLCISQTAYLLCYVYV